AEEVDRPYELVQRGPVASERAEPAHVQGELRAVAQRAAVARGVDPLLPDGLAQHGERPPECAACMLGILFGPEQLAERLARARAVDEGQMGEQGGRLARVERRWPACAGHPWRAEQGDLERRRHVCHRNASWTPVREGSWPPMPISSSR